MDLDALFQCLTSLSCLVTQTTSGLIIGMLFFLVAAGLTLIFGVLGIVNFAHGAFYMVGAYIGYTIFQITGSYAATVIGAGLGAAVLGVAFERFAIRRVYGENVLLQLLVCYGFVLVADDLVQIVWGSEYLSMGMPAAFRMPPLFIAGGIVPPFYLFIIGIAALIALALWWLIERTQYGRIIRATSVNPTMVSALGIPTPLVFLSVFALGLFLAGLAGGLAAPIRALTPGMGFSVLIVSFVVTVIGGMGSVTGALIAALLIGFTRSFRIYRLPAFCGRAHVCLHGAGPCHQTNRPFGPRRGEPAMTRDTLKTAALALAAWVGLLILPMLGHADKISDYIIFASAYGLLAMGLNLLIGYTGLISFGHAMFFASGAYSFGALMQSGVVGVPVAFVLSLGITALIALIVGAICVRLSEIYFAFLTLGLSDVLSLDPAQLGRRDRRRQRPFGRNPDAGVSGPGPEQSQPSLRLLRHDHRHLGVPDAPHRQLALWLYAAHDPRQ